MTQVKFLKRHGSFDPGSIGECEDEYAAELISKGIAIEYDAEAERLAEERRQAEMATIIEKTVEKVSEKIREAAQDPKVKAVCHVKERIEDAPAGGFRSLGDFALAAKDWQTGHRDDKRLLAWMSKAAESGLSEGVDADGGFLVPEQFSNEVLQKVYDSAALVSRCREIPMSTKAVKIPYVKESSRADGSRQGGIRAYRSAELGALSSSKPSFGTVRLELEKLYVFVAASDELLEDAAAMGSMITSAAASELAFKIDDEILNGTGVGQPLGILNAPCKVEVAKETGQPAATLVAENIMKMWSRMWGPSRRNAVWVISQDIEPQLFSMAIAVGTGGVPVYMPANGLAGAPYATLMGRPVIPCESCQTLGTTGDIILADFSQYLYGRHVSGVTSATSMHLKFDYDQTVFRFTIRCDGQPWWSSALTPKNGSNTLSPFVTLATRS